MHWQRGDPVPKVAPVPPTERTPSPRPSSVPMPRSRPDPSRPVEQTSSPGRTEADDHIDITSLPNNEEDDVPLTQRPRPPVDKAYSIQHPPSKQPWATVYPWAQAMVRGLMKEAHHAKQDVTYM
jgi:hypothetical protein